MQRGGGVIFRELLRYIIQLSYFAYDIHQLVAVNRH